MTEVSDRYRTVASGFGARLAGVGPDQWSASTPCSEWTVLDLVAHAIGTQRMVLAALEGTKPEDVDRDGDLSAQWASSSAAVGAALDDPARASKTVGEPFGEQPFEQVVGRLGCADTLVHTWDLARATRQEETLDAGAVTRASEFLTSIDEAIRRPGGFSPKIAPPAGADAQTELLNFCGRAV